MEVVRVREELKSQERVETELERIQKDHARRESEAWRRTATDVAMRALPVIGGAAGRAILRGAFGRRRIGCGCVIPLVAMALSAAALVVVSLL